MKNFEQFVNELREDLISEGLDDRDLQERPEIKISGDVIFFNTLKGQIRENVGEKYNELKWNLEDQDEMRQLEKEMREITDKLQNDNTFENLSQILYLYMINFKDLYTAEMEELFKKYDLI